jgi:hypothetical protein
MPEDYALSLEEIKRMMANAGGTNLAGQSMAGPVATGQSYAQSIAGGMPMSQVIAPGVSYSPEQPSGYTQADLDFLARGPAPVMPVAPTTGDVAIIDDQMPYAPPGVTQPTPFIPGSPFIPGQTPFPGIGNLDFLKDLDFSNLPDFSNIDFSNIDIDAILKDYQDGQDIGEPEPITSFFEAPAPVMPEAPAEVPVSAGLFDFDTEKPTPTSFDFDAIGKPLPSFFDTGENPSIPSFIPKQVFDQVPVMPAPVSDLPVIPNFPIQQPMNFTGLPNIPVMPNIPVPPAAQVYSPPAMPAYTQPRVEDIIAPIRTGSTRRLPQPGLFNLR